MTNWGREKWQGHEKDKDCFWLFILNQFFDNIIFYIKDSVLFNIDNIGNDMMRWMIKMYETCETQQFHMI